MKVSNFFSVLGMTGYTGRLVFDIGKPDGAPRKWLDGSRLAALGWQARIGLDDGLRMTWDWYRAQTRLRGVDAGPASPHSGQVESQ